jgi:hypothetical protein
MSYTNGTNSLARSMNGIITYDDGAGTLIQNGTIITNTLTAKNLSFETVTALNAIIGIVGANGGSIKCNVIDGLNDLGMSNICTLFNNEVAGVIYIGCANETLMYIGYNTHANKVLYVGNYASNVYLGGFKFLHNEMNFLDDTLDMNIANTQFTGKLNIGTALNRVGKITIGNSTNKNVIGNIEITDSAIDAFVPLGDLFFGTNSGNITIGTSTGTNIIGNLKIADNEFDTVNFSNNLNIGISNAGRLNIGGQSPTVFGGGTRIKGKVIDVDTFTDLIIGSITTSALSLSCNSTGTTGPSVITCNNGVIGTPYLCIVQTATQSRLDFHSAGTATTDTRMTTTGGTGITSQGSFAMASGTIGITSNVGDINVTANVGDINVTANVKNINLTVPTATGLINLTSMKTYLTSSILVALLTPVIYLSGMLQMNGGFLFGKGNLSSPSLTQTYSSGMIGPAIPANTVSPTSLSYTFATPFSTVPVVSLSVQNNTATGGSWGVILSIRAVSVNGVVLVAYNAKGTAVAVNSWGYNLIAIGGY